MVGQWQTVTAINGNEDDKKKDQIWGQGWAVKKREEVPVGPVEFEMRMKESHRPSEQLEPWFWSLEEKFEI